MARKPYSFEKRNRELSRQKKQQDKLARKQEARKRKTETEPSAGESDPDIAGIVPGPQPLPEHWNNRGRPSPKEEESITQTTDPLKEGE
ncbi:MAG: hypothetical protein U9R24_06030 [Thermodesulfobacteriota bacterium]|nr:hypothetical protein [Thermodesulfobacteriota bacterium]